MSKRIELITAITALIAALVSLFQIFGFKKDIDVQKTELSNQSAVIKNQADTIAALSQRITVIGNSNKVVTTGRIHGEKDVIVGSETYTNVNPRK